MPVRVDQDVVRLKISMDHLMSSQGFKTIDDLSCVELSKLKGEFLILLNEES
jgi:hypothetical protein